MSVHRTPWVERAYVSLLQAAPFRTYSRLIRVVSGIPVPRPLRRPVLGAIAARVGIDVSEAELGLRQYRSFGELFVRGLQPGARPVDPSAGCVTCPVDGCLTALGRADRRVLIQAKGIDYSLAELVDSEALASELAGGLYMTLYLRPRDYHRIHSPVEGTIVACRHIGGRLFPVKPYMVRNVRRLFTRNERVVIELQTGGAAGVRQTVAMICVAAAGVGNITTTFGANGRSDRQRMSLPVGKGEEVATFNLGSTVILVFAPGAAATTLDHGDLGREVRVGQPVATLAAAPGEPA